MAEAVHGLRRVGAVAVGGDEIDARGAQRQHGLARLHHADTECTRGVVAGTGDHRHRLQSEAPCHLVAEPAGDLRAFVQAGHVGPRQPGGLQHLVAPGAACHVEPHRAGGIGHVAGEVAAEAPAQVVLGQQHLVDALEQIRLVLRQPQQLGRGEARHHQVAGDLPRPGHTPLQLGAFLVCAPVVPENRRTQHAGLGIEQRGTVHLAGQADGLDRRRGDALRGCRGQRGLQGLLAGGPPLRRILLAPQALRLRHRQRYRRAGPHLVGAVQDDDFQARGAQVDADEHGRPLSPSASTCARCAPTRPSSR